MFPILWHISLPIAETKTLLSYKIPHTLFSLDNDDKFSMYSLCKFMKIVFFSRNSSIIKIGKIHVFGSVNFQAISPERRGPLGSLS